MPVIHLRLSNEIDRRLQKLVDEGHFDSKTDAIKTAIIEWLSWREMKTTYKKEGVRK